MSVILIDIISCADMNDFGVSKNINGCVYK